MYKKRYIKVHKKQKVMFPLHRKCEHGLLLFGILLYVRCLLYLVSGLPPEGGFYLFNFSLFS